MNRRNAPKCILGVVVVALFLAVTWSTTAARLSSSTAWTAVKAIATTPKVAGPSVLRSMAYYYATVTTDKAGYVPGETVHVTGTGWQANETVELRFDETPAVHPQRIFYAAASAGGNISNDQLVLEQVDAEAWFTLTATGLSSGLTAETRFSDANLPVDFRQGANNETNGAVQGPGNIHWINSIIQGSNSTYFEGMSVPQRLIFLDIPATAGSVHTLTIRHQATKSNLGIHAYDFQTSWQQAFDAANAIAPGQNLMVNLFVNQCGPEIGPPNDLDDTCDSLHASGSTATPSWPDNLGIVGGDSIQPRITAYETCFNDRTLKIYGNAAISASSIAFTGYTGDVDGNSYANYTISWTSASSDILMEYAGHIAVGTETFCTGVGYGAGRGASSISGGPYHQILDLLDGGSLGNQDNQLKGADVLVPCPTCTVNGSTGPFCPGSAAQSYSVTVNGTCTSQGTITWSLTNNTSGASFNGGNTGATVSVNPGSSCGSFTLNSSFTCSNCPSPVTCNITVSVNDTTPPVITCPGPSTLQCPATVTFGTATATDNCDSTPTITSSDSSTPGCGPGTGTFTRTFTATDDCGNTSTCSQTITVVDTTPPTISCPGPSTIQCPATASFGTPTASDTCDSTPTVTFADSSTPGCGPGTGAFTRTFTATDDCGNTATCSQTITVVDTTPPTISCPGPSTIQCPNTASFGNPTASDTCDSSVDVTHSDSSTPGCGPGTGTFTRTFTATDDCGNTATCSQTITVVDTTPPTISCPGPSTIQCPATASFGTPTASDTCDSTPTVTHTDSSSPGCGPGTGTFTRTFTATDDCGNTATCSQTITVVDTTPPSITCPNNITRGACANTATFAPTVSDTCDSTPTVVCVPPSGSVFPVGVTTVTCTATDDCGNHNSCTFTVTVIGGPSCSINAPPQFPPCGSTGNSLSANVTCLAPVCTLVWSIDATGLGNGWAITGGQGTNSITYTAGGGGTAVFTLSVTDAFGCNSTCSIPLNCAPPQMEFCSLTQGAYGNSKGKFNGIGRKQLIQNLLDGVPLTIGVLGERSITFADNSMATALCIIASMPAGTTPKALPAGFNVSVPPCSVLGPVVGGDGKFNNVLIGQVLALSLNLRLNLPVTTGPCQNEGHDLAGLELCSVLVTRNALPGPDNCLGNDNDVPGANEQNFIIPDSVLCELAARGPVTVQGLLDLANKALAGESIGCTTFGDITAAVDAINRGFDQCRFLVRKDCPTIDCEGLGCQVAQTSSGQRRELAKSLLFPEFAPLANSADRSSWPTVDRYLTNSVAIVVDAESNPAYRWFAALPRMNAAARSGSFPGRT